MATFARCFPILPDILPHLPLTGSIRKLDCILSWLFCNRFPSGLETEIRRNSQDFSGLARKICKPGSIQTLADDTWEIAPALSKKAFAESFGTEVLCSPIEEMQLKAILFHQVIVPKIVNRLTDASDVKMEDLVTPTSSYEDVQSSLRDLRPSLLITCQEKRGLGAVGEGCGAVGG